MTVSLERDLRGKVAVVTGGGGVLCGCLSRALAEYGVKVAVISLSGTTAETVASEIRENGGEAIAIKCNVLEPEDLKEAHRTVLEALGPCDILVNGAGGNHPRATTDGEYFTPSDLNQISSDYKSFYDLEPEGIRAVFDLNFMGTLLPIQEFSRDMADKGGSIINLASMNAFLPLTKIPAYSAAKAGIANFTQWLAVHFSKSGIRVNALAPGFFLTNQNRNLLTTEDGGYTARAEKILNGTPVGRFGVPEEIVGTLLYLADDNLSGFVTGVVIPIDGGFSAYSGV